MVVDGTLNIGIGGVGGVANDLGDLNGKVELVARSTTKMPSSLVSPRTMTSAWLGSILTLHRTMVWSVVVMESFLNNTLLSFMSTSNNSITLYEPASKTITNKINLYFVNQSNLIKFTTFFEQFFFHMHGSNMVIELYSKKFFFEQPQHHQKRKEERMKHLKYLLELMPFEANIINKTTRLWGRRNSTTQYQIMHGN